MAPVLGYWNLRGFGQSIRLLLAHTGTEYEDKRYNILPGKDGEFDKSEWLNVKYNTLDLDFPNLPYYIDGNVKLSQSSAIMRYLGRKHDLFPKTEEEIIRVDLVEGEALDLRINYVLLCYGISGDYETNKPAFLTKLAGKLKEMSNYLGTHQWFAGENMTYIDFVLYEIFDQHLVMEPTLFDAFENLKAYVERFRGLENISAYMKSDKFIEYPLNGPQAAYGRR